MWNPIASKRELTIDEAAIVEDILDVCQLWKDGEASWEEAMSVGDQWHRGLALKLKTKDPRWKAAVSHSNRMSERRGMRMTNHGWFPMYLVKERTNA